MMPQTTMIISQQGFPTILSASSQQQEQQAAPESPVKKPAVRVTKIRRTRQSRNPQQSVARRNERERNRVKLINKGFDVLRDNLPEEYLKAVAPEKCASLNGDETPDLQSVGGNKKSSSSSSSSKAKKFSKVDTLRAAIQHIRMLEELIRSADPHFELVKIPGAISDEASMLGYDELDTAPLSIGQPASCGSSSSQNSQQQHHSYQMYEQPGEQFVKLEPHIHQQIVPPVAQQQPQQPVETSQFQMMTQVHLDHQRQQLQQQQQQQQMSPNSENPSEQTHLWIQQHQTSFGEQQQQCPTDQQAQAQWYTQTAETFIHQQQQHLVLEQQLSPVSLDSPAGQMQHQHHQQQQQYQQQQQQQVWYAESSPSPQQTAPQQQQQQQHLHSAQMGQLSAFSAHQIGLYSQ